MSESLEMSGDADMPEVPGLDVASSLGQSEFMEHHNQQKEQLPDEAQQPKSLAKQPLYGVPPPNEGSASTSSDQPSPLPAAFPKKRRGRPPGRPNMTVREADYDENPLVRAWNAAKGERAVPVVSIGIRAALTEQSLVHETQKAIFRLPSRETIHFVQGWITARHIASQRPSYVNGLLIHSRGQDAPVSCVQCVERRAKHALGPFLTCRVLPGSYHNSCSNCKWFDNTSACSLYTGPKPNRKRKAKDQPPPPQSASIPNNDGANESVPAVTPADGGQENPLAEVQHQNQLPPQSDPESHLGPTPEAVDLHSNMKPDRVSRLMSDDRHDPQFERDHGVPDATGNNSSSQSSAQIEIEGSELAAAPSQSDSLTDSHFLLPKSGREDQDSQEGPGDNDDAE